MRFTIIFKINGNSGQEIIPISYQYELSSWVYKMIHEGDSGFAKWLHNKGYMMNGKSFKLFTFSRLQVPKAQFRISNDRMIIRDCEIVLHLSFLLDEAIEPFITGIFRNQEMVIGDQTSQGKFLVKSIERFPDPVFKETMSVHLLSPLVINKADGRYGEFLHPGHPEYEELFFRNLINKYVAALADLSGYENLTGQAEVRDSNIVTKLEVISEPKSKLVVIKSGTPQETKIRGYFFDFKITAPPALIRTGYFAGFGEKNSLGFGCGEKMKRTN